MIRKDSQAHYYADNMGTADVRTIDQFTVLTCVDGTTYYGLTAYLQQVDWRAAAE